MTAIFKYVKKRLISILENADVYNWHLEMSIFYKIGIGFCQKATITPRLTKHFTASSVPFLTNQGIFNHAFKVYIFIFLATHQTL